MATVLQYSLRAYVPGSLEVGELTLDNFAALLKPLYARVFLDTVWICFLTAVCTLIVAYPIAYALVRAQNRLIKAAILIIAVTPLFLGEVVRTYSWIVVFGNNGFINSALLKLGVIDHPLQIMRLPSGAKTALVTLSEWPCKMLSSSPSRFHSRPVPSADAVRMRRSSGENNALVTGPVCPCSVAMGRPSLFQSRAVASMEAVRMALVSVANTAPVMGPVCPGSVARGRPSRFQSRAVPSMEAVRMALVWLANTALVMGPVWPCSVANSSPSSSHRRAVASSDAVKIQIGRAHV